METPHLPLLRAFLLLLVFIVSAVSAHAEGPAYPGQVSHGADYASPKVGRGDWQACPARCENQSRLLAQKQADAAALAADVAAYNAGVNAARRAGLQSSPNMVEVRTYDANGNYTGTRTMSQTQAEIIGARPQ